MSLRLLSHLASLGFRTDLELSGVASRDASPAAETRAEDDDERDEQTSLKLVMAL